MDYLTVLLWSTIGSVISLVGGLLLISNKRLRGYAGRWALPFGAGALLAAAFLGILPEALEHSDVVQIMIFALIGFLIFFILERMVGWFHHHHHDDKIDGARDKTHVAMVVVGDTLHNAIDGMAIGAAFLVNPGVGITTSLAIAAHEVPQEIGDFGILLGKGVKPKRVIIINILSAMATVVMALLTFWLGGLAGFDPAPLMALAAGMFIYIAASDLIPDIHERPQREANLQALMLVAGVLVIGAAAMLLPHEHGHEGTNSQERQEERVEIEVPFYSEEWQDTEYYYTEPDHYHDHDHAH